MPDLDTVLSALRAEGARITHERGSSAVAQAEAALARTSSPKTYHLRRQGALLAACTAAAILTGACVGLVESGIGQPAHLMSAESLSMASLLRGG